MEAGPMEQTYKIAMDSVQGLDGVQKYLDDAFMQKAVQRFNEMFLDMKEAKKRYDSAI